MFSDKNGIEFFAALAQNPWKGKSQKIKNTFI